MVSIVNKINSLDEATREKFIAALPEDFKHRLAVEHAAGILANLHPDHAHQLMVSGFFNLSTPELVGGHPIRLPQLPGAGLGHDILKTSALSAHRGFGVRAPQTVSNAEAHGTNGNHDPGLRVSRMNLSQSMNSRPLGTDINISLGSKGPGASSSQNFNSMAVPMTAARQLGAASSADIQVSPSSGNAVHLISSQRFSSFPGSCPSGINGHLLRHRLMTSTYLDDFKQGFPSKGLSVLSNHWWGSAEPEKASEILGDLDSSSTGDFQAKVSGDAETNPRSSGTILRTDPGHDEEPKEIKKFCTKVVKSRSRAAVCGRRALKLGVTKGYGVQKLRDKDAAMLQFIFGDSIPKVWLALFPAIG